MVHAIVTQSHCTLCFTSWKNIPVVDLVNLVLGLYVKGKESGFGLLDDVLLDVSESGDVVDVSDGLEWSINNNF